MNSRNTPGADLWEFGRDRRNPIVRLHRQLPHLLQREVLLGVGRGEASFAPKLAEPITAKSIRKSATAEDFLEMAFDTLLRLPST